MEFADVIKRRRMVRAFTTQPLAPGTTDRLLQAANRAPSAGFSQGYAFLVLEGAEQAAPLWEILSEVSEETTADDDPARWMGLRRAPLVIVPLACKGVYLERYARPDKGWTDKDEARWPVPYWYIDTGFAALLALLAVVDEGLGAIFFGIPPAYIDRFRSEFGVPDDYMPIGAVAVGHPDTAADRGGSGRVIKRKTLDELVHRGHW
jgi:nitroreductase